MLTSSQTSFSAKAFLAAQLLMLLETTDAYSSSSQPQRKIDASFLPVSVERASHPPQQYNLGLGVNKPVVKASKASLAAIPETVDEATQFLVEHESVYDYPSPMKKRPQQTAATSQSRNKSSAPRVSRYPALIPHRITDNSILQITQDSQAVAQGSAYNNFELNTAWVEMLIHEQQGLAPATLN